MFQDGKEVFVRHGGVYVYVSTNRLLKDISLPRADDSYSEKTRYIMVRHTDTVKGSHDNKYGESANCQDWCEALG